MNLNERLKLAEMKARHQELFVPWYKKWWGLVILIISSLVLIFLIASGLYIVNRVQQIKNGQTFTPSSAQIQTHLQEINGDGTNYFLGTNNPQITIVEFGDFSCPHCREAYPVVNQLAKLYKNKIKIIWRDYLINSNSIDLAMAARCAGAQGKFWPMHDTLFANQSELTTNDSTRPAKLIVLAQKLGLNTKQFSTCLSQEKYLKQIKKDYADANALGIPGTPTWYVNNHSFSGYLPFNKFNSLIQGLLKLK